MATSALPSNALYNVQSYLRQKRATGAQVTPQNERAAWSGYYDTMAQNSLAERASAMQQQRLDTLKDEQKSREDAATYSGMGQLVSTAGMGAYLLKGTSLGAKIGLGTPPTATAPETATPAVVPGTTAPGVVGTGVGAAPTVASGVSSGTAPTGAAYSTGAAELAGTEAAAAGVGAETGLLSAATPYLGPAGVGFAAGSMIPNMLGFNKGKGELAAGAVSGAVAGAAMGSVVPGAGTVIGGIIGAVAGGVGAKVK